MSYSVSILFRTQCLAVDTRTKLSVWIILVMLIDHNQSKHTIGLREACYLSKNISLINHCINNPNIFYDAGIIYFRDFMIRHDAADAFHCLVCSGESNAYRIHVLYVFSL